jgi:hypothetical protein
MRVYHSLYQQVEQFRKRRGAMAMKDHEVFEKSYEQVLQDMIESLPVEKRLRGLKPEELLKVLKPEELLKVLKPEELLKVLKPEELLRNFTLKQRLQGLTPEDLDALPPNVRETLKRLLH